MTEVLWLHERLLETTGGTSGLRDLGRIEAAIAQPKATFDGDDLYPDVLSKAATLCYGLVAGRGFVDGNKRVGHASMQLFLMFNGIDIEADVGDQERTILGVAAGTLSRGDLLTWIRDHTCAFTMVHG